MFLKNIYSLFIMLILVNFDLCGQKSEFHYKPINISDSSIQWVHVLKDTLFKPDNQNVKLTAYTNLEGPYYTLIKDNKLYISYYSSNNSTNGIYLEKLHLDAGISEATFTWDKRSNGGIRERFENATIKPEGTLEILTSRMPANKFTPQLGVITLDTSDLTKINHSYSSFMDNKSIRLSTIYSTLRWQPLTIPISDSTYINYQRYYELSEQDSSIYHYGIKAVTTDNMGRYLSDTVALFYDRNFAIPLSNKNNNQIKLFQNNDGSFTLFQYFYYDNDSTYAEMFHFDQNINMIDRHNVTHLFDKNTIYRQVQNTTKYNLIILAYNYVEGIPLHQNLIALVLDRQGNLQEKIDLLDSDNNPMLLPLVTKLSGLEGGLVIYYGEDPNTLNISKTDGRGNLKLLKSFEFDKGYFMVPQKLIELPNDELLLFTYYIRDTIVNGTGKNLIYASAVIKFSRKNLGLPTSIKNISPTLQLSFTCSPNPTTDHVELDFKGLFTGRVEIVNNEGRIVESYKLNRQKEYQLSVSHWTTGLYYVNAYPSDQSAESYGTVKLVKE